MHQVRRRTADRANAGNTAQLSARGVLAIAAVYVLATLLTNSYFMADTADYVSSVVARVDGGDYEFWDFGHLFWRPLAWLLYESTRPVTSLFAGDDTRARVTLVYMSLAWVGGLASACLLFVLLRRLAPTVNWFVPFGVTIAFICAHGFLNYSQGGSPYTIGITFLLLALYLLVTRSQGAAVPVMTAVPAGLALAGAVSMWVPFVLVVPGTLLLPLLLYGFDRKRWKVVLATAVFSGLVTAAAYLVVATTAVGVTNLAGFRAWMAAAAHETDIGGVARMIFGFGRSFIYMGNDGAIVKRYLLDDPFNPVGFTDLLRLSLWKLLFFYLFLAAIAGSLLMSRPGRRVLTFAVITALPLMMLAALFDGGAIERYLPIYPAVFIAFAASLWVDRSISVLKYTAVTFAAIMIVVDVGAMAEPVLHRRQEETAARIADLHERLQPQDMVVTVNWQDDLINFGRSFPLHPLNRAGTLRLWALATPGTAQTERWREEFAQRALLAWEQGGQVWISVRALSPRPSAEWNWVEGDDERVSWTDFYDFFSGVELGERIGGADGFALVPPSANNRQFFERFA